MLGIYFILLVSPMLTFAVEDREKSDLLIGVSRLSDRLLRLAETTLGVSFLQSRFKELSANTYISNVTDSTLLKIADTLKAKIEKAYAGLSVISSAVKTAPHTDYPSCCGFTGKLVFNQVFRQEVDKTVVCGIGSGTVGVSLTDFNDAESAGLLQNAQIYFGHVNGSYVQWPAMNLSARDDHSSCRRFEPGLSPWYVSALRPISGREVVFLVDVSYPSYKTARAVESLMQMLLNAFDPRDKIGVVLFDNTGPLVPPTACLKSSVMQATPSVLKEILRFVSNRLNVSQTQAVRNFSELIRMGVSRFTANSSADKCVVLVTAGLYNVSIKAAVNEKYGSQVHVLALGDYPESSEESISSDNVRYVQITESNPSTLARYLHRLWPPEYGLKFTMPYYDFSVAGHLIDMTTACCKGSPCNFLGVAGFSLIASEFFSVEQEVSSESYYFIIDSNGIAYFHPKLRYPTAWKDKSMAVHITNLETAAEFTRIAEVMSRWPPKVGLVEKQSILVNVSVARGHSLNDGSKFEERLITYMWTKVDRSDFVVVLVVQGNFTNDQRPYSIRFSDLTPGTDVPLYYQLNLYTGDQLPSLCTILATVAVGNRSSVKLSPDKFKHPSRFLEMMTAETKDEMISYFRNGKDPPLHILKSVDSLKSVRNYIVASDVMEDFWSKDSSEERFYTMWKYVGFEDGTFRSFPGHFVQHLFDPRNRPWYNLAKSNEGKIVLTPPYVDAATLTPIITLAKTLLMNSEAGKLAGVMGVDFSLKHFGAIINQEISLCTESSLSYRCFVLDSSGYILYFPDTGDSLHDSKTYHIIEKEPLIAASMISQRLMIKNSCIARTKPGSESWQMTHEYHFYTIVSLSYRKFVAYPEADDCSDFTLVPIPETNVFLLMAKSEISSSVNCADVSMSLASSDHSLGDASTPVCSGAVGAYERPCYKERPCLESLSDLSTLMLCPIPLNSATLPYGFETWLKGQLSRNLPKCNDPLCTSLSSTSCIRIGCVLLNGKCDYQPVATVPPSTATLPSATTSSPWQRRNDDNDDDDRWMAPFVAVLVVLGVATSVLGLVLVFVLRRLKKGAALKTNTTTTNVYAEKSSGEWF